MEDGPFISHRVAVPYYHKIIEIEYLIDNLNGAIKMPYYITRNVITVLTNLIRSREPDLTLQPYLQG